MLTRASRSRVPVTQTENYPAPSGGWVQSGNIVTAKPNQAERLDNFIPTAQGARLRGGAQEYCDVGAAVVQLFTYNSGGNNDLLAATADSIFDAYRLVGGSNAYAEAEGFASGDWSATQISTSGGQFTIAVNGSDYMQYWDGTEFNPVTDEQIEELGFDAETAAFAVGETLTGGTSGATAEIIGIKKTSATAGALKLGAITGTFQDDETITDSATGSATVDGTSSTASTVTLTNVATTALSQVWLFKERLFFVEKDTTSVWYLPVESIGGAATEIDLGSIFQKGGSVLFGATWSLDSGSGLDDVCLFVTDQGEVAVYEGTNPANASTWSLVGVYDIGLPLNKHGFFKAGGDLAILTEDGIIPVSEALKKDRAALQTVAISYPIEDAWRDGVSGATASHPVSVTLWQSRTFLLIGTPLLDGNKYVSYVANARTGAWGRVTGWDVRCSAVAQDQLYFGNSNGKVLKADTGGDDDGSAYTAEYVPKFSYSDVMRTANFASLTYRASEEVDFNLYAHADYVIDPMTPPQPIDIYDDSAWGTGIWGTFVWGAGEATSSFTARQAVRASGYALAPGLSITSNRTGFPSFELLSMRLRAESGYAL